MRPNLLALSRCRVLSVHGAVIEIDCIDGYTDTRVIDMKPGTPRQGLAARL